MLNARLENTLAQPHFVSMLQHLLLVPTDERHLHLWRLFDLVLRQISLHTALGNFAPGDPQFTPHLLLQFDMDDLLARLHTHHEHEGLEKRVSELNTELDAERQRVVELENRLADLQDGVSLVSSFSRCIVHTAYIFTILLFALRITTITIGRSFVILI